MSGGIETTQLTPLDTNPDKRRAAATTCADYAIRHQLDNTQLLEILRAIGLAHDPHALERDPMYDAKVSRTRAPQ